MSRARVTGSAGAIGRAAATAAAGATGAAGIAAAAGGAGRLGWAVLLAAAAGAAWAQVPPPAVTSPPVTVPPSVVVPDAGRALQEADPAFAPVEPPRPSAPVLPQAPAPQPPSGDAPAVSFELRSLRITGNTVFDDATLQAFAAGRIGQRAGFADLERIAQAITEHYRRAGYFLAQAVLPPQTVADGVVHLSVMEGRLGRVRIEQAPETPVPERLVAGLLARLPAGRPLRAQALEQAMLLVSDVPGLAARSSLEAGDEPGTTDLVVEITPSRRWDLALDADNFGSRAVGQHRVGLLGRVRSPLSRGDNLDVRLLQSSGGGLTFARLGYELPVGSAGTRAGLAVAHVDYSLGGEFAALRGFGRADIVDATVTHPLVRSRTRNLVLRGGFTVKRLHDRLEALDATSDKTVRALNAGATHEMRDALLGGGYTSLSVVGHLGELDAQARPAPVGPAADLRTAGRFARAVYQAARLQSLGSRLSAYVGLAGQFASRNLDSAEKIALGGPTAVRAYPIAEAIVDTGHILNAELRASVAPALSASLFYDAAWGRPSKDPRAGEPDSRVLRGYGVGLHWSAPAGFTLRAGLAWRLTGPARSDRDGQPRLFAQLAKTF